MIYLNAVMKIYSLISDFFLFKDIF